MKSVNRKRKFVFFALGIVAIFSFICYVIWENNHIVINTQEIQIENLDDDFHHFTIVQISDLHNKQFGNNQQKLIDIVNSIDYNVIVFTGDMVDNPQTINYAPFFKLIEGIHNKDHALFVSGNTDPENYLVRDTVVKSRFIKEMEKRGVYLLEGVHQVEHGDRKVYFVDFELSIKKSAGPNDYVFVPSYSENERYLAYENKLLEGFHTLEEMDPKADLLIALTHYPIPDERFDFLNYQANKHVRDYDLIVAGHYHGGQIRLPILGALFVPEPFFKRGGLFPPQDRVRGLWEYKGIKQYVSSGLGSSKMIPFLSFRLFNPPEINVLTFTKK